MVGERLGVILALLAVWILWGGTYLATRYAIQSIPTFFMLGARFLIAGVVLYAVLRLRGISAPTGAEWRGAAIVGGLLLTIGMGGTALSQSWVSSSLAALGVASTPIWASLMAGFWGRWPAGRDWLGLGLGFAGVVLLNLEGEMRANPLGALLLLGASLSWAFGSVLAPRLTLPKGLMATAAEMLCAGAMFPLIGLLRGERLTQAPTTSSLVAFAYLVICGSLIAFSAYGFLLRRVRPALATSPAYVNPIVAVALGVGFAGERIGPVGLAAMAVIVSGVALLAIGRERRASSNG
jgi:drug/metabolite transporter (DMT)-like permease